MKATCKTGQTSDVSYFDGANFLRQLLLQCSSRETLAIGSAFKCERGWMDGACFHGDESVARVLIMLLRRGSGAGNSEPCAPDAMVQRLRRIPLWSHLTSTPTPLPSPSHSFSLSPSLPVQPSRLIGLQILAVRLRKSLACDCRTSERVGNMQACRPIQALTDQSRKIQPSVHRCWGREEGEKRSVPQQKTASTNNGVIIRESH
jgi:hypothetical protein